MDRGYPQPEAEEGLGIAERPARKRAFDIESMV